VTRGLRLALCALPLLACVEREPPAPAVSGPRREPTADPAARGPSGRTILFGDLHVHTTWSMDAFIYSLPLLGGEGVHPPADACDYARWCSALDFMAITDHAEGLPPEKWRDIVDATRQCNAVAGPGADPDLVAFIGWEWTQVGVTPEDHFGHKNVLFPGLADGEIPRRPIGSLPPGTRERAPPAWLLRGVRSGLAGVGQDEYAGFLARVQRMAEVPECEPGRDVRELPVACVESAETPEVLFEKLRQWGFESLVIPHGLAWGAHAPPGSSLDIQLSAARHDPDRQRLLEVFSGHGNSEEWRAWRDVAADGTCPAPRPDYLPCCWQAGEIVRARCGDRSSAECEARVAEARRLALEAGVNPERVLPDTGPEDWLDCGQCRDCFKPTSDLRPGQSAQYALAIGNFDGAAPLRFRFGLIGSSDDHKAQPGTGFKQVGRRQMTDARGLQSERAESIVDWLVAGRSEDPARAQPAPVSRERGFGQLFDSERGASFLYPGGLAAVHADGRDRASIWQALRRREVFGTSGPRILLWFDLVNGPAGRVAMGGETALGETPRFEARAVGAFVQQPGCPADAAEALSPARLDQLCRGECYHPSDQRRPIAAIEVVRIRPQRDAGEDVAPLIEDPWRRLECPPDPAGCAFEFEDPEFAGSGRDAVYYVRALQEPTPAINGANLRTEFDADGNAVSVDPCFGGFRTPAGDDCLAPVQERAWSSPIFVDQIR
jgi:hypothetical protein